MCVFMSHLFNLEAFEANSDVLMFLVFHKCFISLLPVFHQYFTSVTPAQGTTVPGDNCTSQPFQVGFQWDKKRSWSIQFVELTLIGRQLSRGQLTQETTAHLSHFKFEIRTNITSTVDKCSKLDG